ncbi:molybdate ABC transporter substrate-binding protein [Rhodoplanes sp. Z2-YC6860]|uniref:molybdate ABC transporter substrate-binding protein n=1 Tax=Rhodoplanes sp. Z2-YC6860 TaxID=674703 RepID=UPI00078C4528|nr:molybdate ABC transporter substrate-binding protein [Rhodoplanes sp. Z2-YC6860]AMN42425.1 molybdate ABC transporter periplasmic-binding protein [Rhodoplanes sp. Z2-YC6860]
MSTITVLSSLATREAYLELVPQFEATNGHKVETTWAGTVNIMKRMADGEVFDLVISSSASIKDLTEQKKIVAGSAVNLSKTGIGIGVRKGAKKPDVGTSDAFRQTMLAAKSVGLSTGPSGVYLEKLFERLGIADAVKPKIKQIPSGGTVAPLVASGEAEIGFQQISEIAHAEGIDYVGRLPPDLQLISVFTAGVHTGAKHSTEAQALVKFLTAPAGLAVMKKHGLEAP